MRTAFDIAASVKMCLQKGVWNGRQIVSQQWLKEMTTPRTVESKYFRGMSYGYLWWIVHPEKCIYAAIGNSGNVIYVNPDTNTVAAVTSFFKPTIFDRVDFIEEVLLPTVG